MASHRWWIGLSLVAVTLWGSAALAASPHARALALHREDDPFPPGPPLPADVVDAARDWELARPHAARGDLEVIGYLPYWVGGDDGIRFDVLTQLNYFAAEVDGQGNITALHGWGDTASEQLVAAAHAEGCRVCLVATNFDTDSLSTLLGDPSHRAAAIDNLLEQVLALDADGVDVDFERLASGDKQHLVSFMQELQSAFTAAMGDPWITLATPAVDWSGAYDYDELIEASNGLFVMGYSYHWSGSDPGPNAPKHSSATWGTYSLEWSVEDYLEWGGETNRHEVYLGLPLYGRDWPSVSDAIPGEATGTGESVVYHVAVDEAVEYGEQWDAESDTPYYMYQAQGWHQVWYDDAESILSKIELVDDHDIGGFGFWALQFDDNDPDLWDELAALVDDDDTDDDDTGDDDTSDDDVSDDDTGDDDTGDDDDSPLVHPPPRENPGDGDQGCSCAAPAPGSRLALLFPVGLALLVRRHRSR